MSKSRTENGNVRCPFWLGLNGKRALRCEGAVEGCETQMLFRREEGRKAQMKAYCQGEYARCPVCQAIMAKYQEEE